MSTFEHDLMRWREAGLLDEATARRIREFEAREVKPAGHRWQVTIALTLGGILLGTGLLLYVAAHWDRIGPGSRFRLPHLSGKEQRHQWVSI